MHFRVLGPLAVDDNGSNPLRINAPMLRRLLAALLTHPNEWVSTGDLAQALWGANCPPSFRKSLQVYVRRLRQALDDDRRIAHGRAGYRITVRDEELDATRFAQAIQAADAVGPERAYDLLSRALDMWRGRAYEDVREHAPIVDEARRLDEERLRAESRCAQLQLDLGQHAELVPHLAKLTQLHPYNEELRCQLMLALYRSGRQIEALEVFHATRTLLDEELGVEPGPALRHLHEAILRRDASLDPARRDPAAIPRELPAPISGFAGRSAEMSALDLMLAERSPASVVALTGSAGMGKTTLAVHWAHSAAERFPDGQVYVNLRGFDPVGSPVASATAVRRLLHALGVTGQHIPADPEAQIALYRSLLSGKRLLLLLDNAREAEQVRPLLPGSTTCRTLVTSRNRLTSLVVTNGAHCLDLEVLSVAEARQLLVARLGTDRVAAEPESADGVIAQCAGVPLALAVVAARAVTDRGLTLRTLEKELRQTRGSLGAFDTGDPATDLRAVFSWSYEQLSPDAAQLFRMLGLCPGPDVGLAAAASLVAKTVSEVAPAMAELSQAHLLSEPAPGRFALHDLLRAYAAEQGRVYDTPARRNVATRRLLDFYLHTAYRASRLLEPHRNPVTLVAASSNQSLVELEDREAAQAWLEAEYQVLAGAVRQAADAELGVHAWQLAWSLSSFLDWQGHGHELVETHRVAMVAAQKSGDVSGQAYAHHGLARAYLKLDLLDEAYAQLRLAADRYAEAGNPVSHASTHLAMAYVLQRQNRLAEALEQAGLAHRVFEGTTHRAGQVAALNAIGWLHSLLGQHQIALSYCEQALSHSEELDDINTRADIWDSIGHAHHHLGSYAKAICSYRKAISLYQDLRNLEYQAVTMTRLGETYVAAENRDAAHAIWTEALEIFVQLDHPNAGEVRSKLDSLARSE